MAEEYPKGENLSIDIFCDYIGREKRHLFSSCKVTVRRTRIGMGRNPVMFFGKGKIMKRYRAFSDIFEGTLCSREQLLPDMLCKQSDLLSTLIKLQDKENRHDFWHEIREIIERKMNSRYLAYVTFILFFVLISVSVFWDFSKADWTVQFRLIVIGLAFVLGVLVTVLYHRRLSWGERTFMFNFLNPLVEVLWAVAEHQDGKQYEKFPKTRLRKILLNTNEKDFRKFVDLALVHLAFEVKKLEPKRTDDDLELNQKRARRELVHQKAVKLKVAATNPQTYFDRAIPASQTKVKVEDPTHPLAV